MWDAVGVQGLPLQRGGVVEGGVGAVVVEPVNPLGGGDLDVVDVAPGALVADEFGLVQGVQCLGQCVVVGLSG